MMNILIMIVIGVLCFYLGFKMEHIRLFLLKKKESKQWIKIYDEVLKMDLKPEYFMYRINYSVYFLIDDVPMVLFFNQDSSYSYIVFYNDSTFNEYLYSSKIDDHMFGFTYAHEKKLIDKIKDVYNDKINNVQKIGDHLYDVNYVKKQLGDLSDNVNINFINIDDDDDIMLTSNKEVYKTNQEIIDDILDQINISGYNSLSIEQKEILNSKKDSI